MIAIYTYHYSRTGSRHTDRGEKKQDTIVVSENPDFQSFALADGVSACKMGGTGARIAAMRGCNLMLRLGADARRFAPEKTAALLMEEVLHHLKWKSHKDGLPLSEYASTLTVCVTDRSDPPTALICQLGDSPVLLCGAHSCIRLPGSAHAACQTTSFGAKRAMDVTQVSLRPDQHLCLCSDGFMNLFRNPCWGDQLRSALCRRDHRAMKAIVDAANPEDDCTFLLLTQQIPGR